MNSQVCSSTPGSLEPGHLNPGAGVGEAAQGVRPPHPPVQSCSPVGHSAPILSAPRFARAGPCVPWCLFDCAASSCSFSRASVLELHRLSGLVIKFEKLWP